MIQFIRYFVTVQLFFSIHLLCAQSGWDYIKANDNIEARKAFSQALKTDSNNIQAIQGLIYLSDIEGDKLLYNRYVNKLLTKNWTPELQYIFSDRSNVLQSESFDESKLTGAILLEKELSKAADYKYERRFDDYSRILQENFNQFNWSIIGPFASVNGYGYVQSYDPELKNFDPNLKHRNIFNQNLFWLNPTFRNPTGAILFDEHLSYSRSGGVYYANSFFSIDEDDSCEIKVTRTYPIKIWLDDQLVYTDPEKINPVWDQEILKVKLKKGKHRLLIKYVNGEVQDRFDRYRDSDWGESFNSYNSYDYLYGYLNYSYYDGAITAAKKGVVVRLTDDKGKLISLKAVDNDENYSAKTHEIAVDRLSVINYYKNQIAIDSENWFNYYLLIEAYNAYGVLKGLEKELVKVYNADDNSVFFKYLLSKVYLYNGKREKSYEIMNHIDLQKTPVFNVLYKGLQELDPENQPKMYLDRLMLMLDITPSNIQLIMHLLDYYDEKGLDDEKKDFAKQVKEDFPQYKYQMDRYLEDDHKPTDYDIGTKEENKESQKWERKYRDKKGKTAKKNIRSRYVKSDYEHLIKIYKNKDDVEEVLKLYDALITIEPHKSHYRKEKAEYLYNKDRLDEALVTMKEIIASKPYESNLYELIGDIYKDQKDNAKALEYYEKAKAVKGGAGGSISGSWMNYGGTNLKEKIAQIEGQKQFKNKFDVPEFSDWLADTTWKEKYKNEESVVLGFSNEVLMDDNGEAYLWGKILIQIVTEAGANSWTEHDFYQFGSLDYVKVIKKDGAEVYPEHNGTYVVFKNLSAGDMIMLEGKVSWGLSSERGNELTYFQRMMFHAPVHFAKVEVAVPQGTYLGHKVYKLEDNLQRTTKEGYDFYTWKYHNIPKVVDEEAILDETDTYAMIMVSTIKDWSPIVEWYKAKTYRKLESNYEIERILEKIISDTMSENDKVVAIYNWITKEINYSFTRLLQSGFIPKSTEHTCSSKIGDCKDVATLMISMLRHEGIDAYYVLVKTNSYFHQEILPSIYFDHVITGVELDGKDWYFDLTTDFYPHYVTNENDAEAWALKIKDGVTTCFQLPNDYIDPKKNLVKHDMTCVLNKDKSMDMKVKSVHSGMRGGYIREVMHNKPRADFKNEILDYMGKGVFGNLELIDFKFQNRDDITAPLISEYEFKAQDYSDDVLDIHFFKIPWMVAIEKHTAILSDERHNTLDVGEITNIAPVDQKMVISFPSTMKLRSIPKDIEVENEFGIYRLTFKRVGKSLEIEKYQEFKQEQIGVEKFAEFKEYYQKILKYDNMKIVLY